MANEQNVIPWPVWATVHNRGVHCQGEGGPQHCTITAALCESGHVTASDTIRRYGSSVRCTGMP